MLFSHVKISSFRVKAHLVFQWWLYNKNKHYLLLFLLTGSEASNQGAFNRDFTRLAAFLAQL